MQINNGIAKVGRLMKRALPLFVLAICSLTQSCDDEDSYAADRKRERRQVQSFLQRGALCVDKEMGDTTLYVPAPIKVITEEEFLTDTITDVSLNEYVYFPTSGIYMQIVRRGSGEMLQNGKTANVICRYTEFDISTDSIKTTNNAYYFATMPDIMTVTNTSGTFTASFTSGVMKTYYGANVPGGWLYPLSYIKVGRQVSAADEVALVRVIVPSTEGQADAYTNVYPCFYEISYQLGR